MKDKVTIVELGYWVAQGAVIAEIGFSSPRSGSSLVWASQWGKWRGWSTLLLLYNIESIDFAQYSVYEFNI